MTATLLCAALAVLAAPPERTRLRFRAVRAARRPGLVRLPEPEYLVFALCVPAALIGGIGGFIAALAVSGTARIRIRRSRLDRHRDEQRRQLLAGLEILIAELRVGAHPVAAASTAAAECAGTAARAFEIGAARGRLGGSVADGLRRDDEVIGTELTRIAAAWRIADDHGLALAELLEASRRDLLARIRFRDRTESGLAGARATAAVLAGLPMLGIALGHLMGAAPLKVLFGGGLGAALLIIGTTLACAGLLWSDAITRRVAP
ncbi:MAG: type II secretion system F family protein [Aldersonia sp.]|nr:type II secretion system F family protein [Aldersonia sp.]